MYKRQIYARSNLDAIEEVHHHLSTLVKVLGIFSSPPVFQVTVLVVLADVYKRQAEYSQYGSFTILAENNRKQIQGLIEELAATQHEAGSVAQKIRCV